MNVCKEHDFGMVRGYELGFSPIGRPVMNTVFYWIDGILIDTAQHHMRKAFVEIINDKKIDRVLLTHHHEDHSGNAALVAQLKKVAVLGHPITAAKLKKGFPILPYQRIVWGKAKAVSVEQLPKKVETDHYSLQPIHTPGHSKDHMVYFERSNGWLFSGDLYLGSFIKYFRADEKIHDTIESIKEILSLDFDSLFCAHNPKPTNGKKALRDKLAFLETFCGEVLHLHEKGYDIDNIILTMGRKEVTTIKFWTNGNVSLRNMVNSAISDTPK